MFPKGYRIENTKALEDCKLKPCLICGQKADPHHIKSRGAGGNDVDWNLIPLCRFHHTEVHKIGLSLFQNKYYEIQQWLLNNGWTFDLGRQKWTHDEN